MEVKFVKIQIFNFFNKVLNTKEPETISLNTSQFKVKFKTLLWFS